MDMTAILVCDQYHMNKRSFLWLWKVQHEIWLQSKEEMYKDTDEQHNLSDFERVKEWFDL